MENGFCGGSRQRHFHILQKVGGFANSVGKNLMQGAVTVARGPAAIASRRTSQPPKTQNLDRTLNNIVKLWGKL